MKLLSKVFPPAAALLFWLGCPLWAVAHVAHVSVGLGGLVFVPAVTNIHAGDQVIWTWAGTIPHSTTSGTNGVPSGLWDSGTHSAPFSFTNTFTTAGDYSYYCVLHYAYGMTGAVQVAAASLPPTVALTNPPSGAVFAAPADVTLQASAAAGAGSVTNVQFLVGATVLTNETAPPFSAVAANLAAGNYTLQVIAADTAGLTATNAVGISVVTPLPMALNGAVRSAATNFEFRYSANVGLNYVVQRSTNLVSGHWMSLATNTAASNPVSFEDLHATNHAAFYRIGRLPNP